MRSYTIVLLLVSFFPIFSFAQEVTDTNFIYVAKCGSDVNNGSISKPFATLEAARNAIKMKRKGEEVKQPIVVYLRHGVYFISKSFELNNEDAATTSNPIIYKAYPGEYVELNGGKVISSKDAELVKDLAILKRLPDEAKGKVYQINLAALGIKDFGIIHSTGFRRPYFPAPMEMFINKSAMHLSRYPNDSSLLIEKVIDVGSVSYDGDYSNRGGVFVSAAAPLKRWKQAKELWIGGYFNAGYADDFLPIKTIDEKNNTITTAQSTMFGFAAGKDFRRWYAFNLLEEIDSPGEYFIDRSSGILYFYPSVKPENAFIELSMLEEPMIVLSGASNISFQNITLENMRGMAVYIDKGDNNIFKNCTFRNIGMVGVVIGKGIEPFKIFKHDGTGIPVSRALGSWHEHIYANTVFDREAGKQNGIVECRLYNIGMGAISLGGGNRKTLEAAGNYVVNCELFNFNRLGKTYKAAVNVDGVGNRIANNHIHNADQAAIYIHGNNHLIEYNEINNTCQTSEDMGAIYMGRDPSEAGNIIRYNYLHHIIPRKPEYMVAAIYFDDGDVNGLVYGNVFYKTGNEYFGAIFNHGGHGHLFENNIFIDCPRALGNEPWNDSRWSESLQSDLIQYRLYKAVEINKPPYSWQYPDLAQTVLSQNRTSGAIKNLVVQCDVFSVPQYHLEQNWITKKDPGFVDFKNENFQLKGDAEVFRQIPGFTALPFQNMGIQTKVVGNPYDQYISTH